MTRHYELTYLIWPEFSEEEIKSYSEKIDSFIIAEGGKLEKNQNPVKTILGYSIKGKTEAFLITIEFFLEAEKIANLEKKLKAEKQILRYIVLTKKVSKKIHKKRTAKKEKEKPPKETLETIGQKKVALNEIDKKIEEILNE